MGQGNRIRILMLVGIVAFFASGLPALAQDNPIGEAAQDQPDLEKPFHQTWSRVTVTDISGWRYENVSLWWVGDGKMLRLRRPDGAERDFAPVDIATITDANGRDLTAEVAAGMNAQGQPTLTPPRVGTSAPGQNEIGIVEQTTPSLLAEMIAPKAFDLTMDLVVGYAIPSGQWFQGADNGVNFGIGMRVSVSQKNYLRLMYRRQDLGQVHIPSPDDFYYEDMDLDMTADEFMFLLGFHNSFNSGSKFRSLAYIEFGPAAVKYNVSVSNQSHLSDSLTKFGLAVNLGALVPLNSHFALDIGANLVHKPGWTSENEPGGLLIGGHLGLSLYN